MVRTEVSYQGQYGVMAADTTVTKTGHTQKNNAHSSHGAVPSFTGWCDRFLCSNKTYAAIVLKDGTTPYLSPNYERLSQHGLDISTDNFLSLIHADDASHLLHLAGAVLKDAHYKESIYAEYRMQNTMGKTMGESRWFKADIQPFPGMDNAVILISHDITSLKEQRTMDQLDRCTQIVRQSRELLLSHMNHELRTPLNAILGFSELLQLGKGDDVAAEYATIIRQSGKSLLHTIEQLVHITRASLHTMHLQEESHDLRTLFAELATECEQGPYASLPVPTFFMPSFALWAYVDARKLRQAFLCLLHFMNDQHMSEQKESSETTSEFSFKLLKGGAISIESHIKITMPPACYEQALTGDGSCLLTSEASTHGVVFLALAAQLLQLHEATVMLHTPENQGQPHRLEVILPASRILSGGLHASA